MPSPFPGMNPWLEQDDVFHDFHQRFVPRLADQLGELVRPSYIVKVDDHVFVHEPPTTDERRFAGRPDVFIAERMEGGDADAATALADAPVQATLVEPRDEEHVSYLEILDRKSRKLVTVLEVLSPSNKSSHRRQYLDKRYLFLTGGVNVVELDLLRGGQPMPVDGVPESDYRIMVAVASQWPRVGVWPVSLRDPLPEIPVPLRDPDPPVKLDLQGTLHRVYDAAVYEEYVYDGSPEPPLLEEDAAWAAAVLEEASARPRQ